MKLHVYIPIQTLFSSSLSFLIPFGFLNLVFYNHIYEAGNLNVMSSIILSPFITSIVTGYLTPILLPEMKSKFNLETLNFNSFKKTSKLLFHFGSSNVWNYALKRHIVIATYALYLITPLFIHINKTWDKKKSFESALLVSLCVLACNLFCVPQIILCLLIKEHYEHMLKVFKYKNHRSTRDEFIHRVLNSFRI